MIGIIGAMEVEVDDLRKQMTEIDILHKAGMDFYKGLLREKEVVVVRSGIGKVNAAVCTQILVDDFEASVIINTGVAGGLNPAIKIGDIVISTEAIQHDFDVTALGYPIGQVPGMDVLSFPADATWIERARKASQIANPDVSVFVGRVVSGDAFVSSKEKKEELVALFQPECTEMEGASIAQVAYLNEIPCLIIRAISDQADQEALEDYPTFERKAAQRSVRLMLELVAMA